MTTPLIEQICNRVSCPRLAEPAPAPDLLASIYQCALRAPDHMMLRPWRYLVVEGDAREGLGELFCQAAEQSSGALSDLQRDKYCAMPMRAPLILIGVSRNLPHPKVPPLEQELSCGVGLGYILLALQAEGFAGIWRTGPLVESEMLKKGLGLAPEETIVGFLYIGTPIGELKPVPQLSVEDYFSNWSPE